MNQSHLTHRWTTPEGERLRDEVVARILAGKPLFSDLGLGEFEGRIDLRGLVIPPPYRELRSETGRITYEKVRDNPIILGARFEALDFSDAQIADLSLGDSVFVDCKFDRARLSNWGQCAGQWLDVSFVATSLREANLGFWWRNHHPIYQRVDFTRADLRYAHCSTGRFSDCDFSQAKLNKADFRSCNFVRCRFAGRMRDVDFSDYQRSTHHTESGTQEELPPPSNGFEDCDFSQAKPIFCMFRGRDLSGMILPKMKIT